MGVEQWAELRREHFVRGKSIKELARRDGAVAQHGPGGAAQRASRRAIGARRGRGAGPVQGRDPPAAARGSEADRGPRPRADRAAGLPGGQDVVDDYLREVRPLFAPPPRTFQRTVYRPGEICQFDVWQPREEIPVGHGQTRRGWVVSRAWATRARAPARWSSRPRTQDLLAGIAGCLERLGGLPQTLRLGSPGRHPRPRRSPDRGVRRLLRPAPGRLALLRAGRSAGQGRGRAAAGLRRRRNFEPGRRFANELDFQAQLDAWFDKANARTHKTLKVRPIDRLADERRCGARCPSAMPDTARRWMIRVPPDPYLRVDTNDYSLDPRAGRPPRRGPRRPDARCTARRARHRRAGLPARARLRAPPDDHRARARPRAEGRRDDRRDSDAGRRSGRWHATTR